MSTRARALTIVGVAVVAAAAAFVAWWFLRDDAPEAVSLDTAVEGSPAAGGAAGEGIDGTWTVDAESGDFDDETATGTFVGFRIAEELASVGRTEAVGRTGEVSGEVAIDGTTLTAASVEADMTSSPPTRPVATTGSSRPSPPTSTRPPRSS